MKYKQPIELIGEKCFECGNPANMWRLYKCPILPWCSFCRARMFEKLRKGIMPESENEKLKQEIHELKTKLELLQCNPNVPIAPEADIL